MTTTPIIIAWLVGALIALAAGWTLSRELRQRGRDQDTPAETHSDFETAMRNWTRMQDEADL
ncbi:hypothetical protein KX928_23190 [Roseobacter sp. YSTF-M11]|uniref:Uncharacterized protein n=1 Tax=Roseobacter insulae TaxID=2859783 RepID=A0A9X1FYU3_9RHOB|nr:hypothetical protein [Roseobacter insulae]MBW4710705.1 hypothetical protein [Roseobacter insulae]